MARVTTDGWENMEPANVFRTIRASARAGSWYTVPRAHASRLSAVIKPQFVRVAPGSMSTTFTPNGAISMRRASENASTAYLDTLYQPPKYRQALPQTEEILIIRPSPRERIPGSTFLHSAASPKRFTSICRRPSSSETVSMGPKEP